MRKRGISLLLAVLMVFGLCGPLGALVPEAGAAYIPSYRDGCFEYMLDENGNATISGIWGNTEANVIFPDTLGGYPVTGIGNLSSDCVTTIESVEIPGTIKAIGEGAFEGFKLKKVTIYDGTLEIGESAFEDCELLTEISLPNTLTSIGNHAFYNSGLISISFPSSITTWGDFICSRCENLTNVKLPSNMKEIPQGTFSNCLNLTNITLPEGLEAIGTSAFYHTGLVSIKIPDTVTTMGTNTFQGCDQLKTVYLSENLQGIPEIAFSSCDSLQTISIPNGVTSIGRKAFDRCYQLKCIFIPQSVVQIDDEAFSNCTNLTDVYYAGSEAEWDAIESKTYNDPLPNATIHFNSTSAEPDEPAQDDTPVSTIPTPILNDLSCTEEGVYVSWILPLETPDRQNTVEGFYIFRKTGSGSYQRIAELDEYSSMYMDTTVQEGQTYTYTVQAYYQNETGDYDQTGKTITWTAYQGVNGTDQTMQVVVSPTAGDWANLLPLYKQGQNGNFTISLSKKWVDFYPELFQEDQGLFAGSMQIMDSNGTVIYTQEAPIYYMGMDGDTANLHTIIDFEQFAKLPLQADQELTCVIYDKAGKVIDSAQIRTSYFQRWGFKNYSANIPEQMVVNMFGKSKAKQLLQQAKNSNFTMGGDGLCFGMSALASLVNADYIPANLFDGCEVLDQVKKDTKLSGVSNAEDADELIQMSHLLQYKPSVQAQLEAHRGDYAGLKTQMLGFENGLDPMPLIYIKDTYEHVVCAYNYSEDVTAYHFYVYDSSLMDKLGIIRVEKSSGNWSYVGMDYDGGPDTFSYYTVENIKSWTNLDEDCALLSTKSYDDSNPNLVSISWISNAAQSEARSEANSGLYWVSGSQPVELSGPGSMADDYAIYDVAAAESCIFSMRSGQVSQVSAEGENVEVQCQYPGADGTDVTVAYTGENREGEAVVLTYDADGDTVRFSGGEDGTVTVTYENGETWTKPVESGEELNITADGKNEPTINDDAFTDEEIAFRDVPSNAYYADAVKWAVDEGITTGTSATTFSPDAPCTRAQVVTFIWRAFGLDELGGRSTENPFRDVPSGVYYRDPVLWAAENGITTGTDATHFSPDAACTRAQVVTFLWRTDFPTEYISGGQAFQDVHRTDYYWYPVQWAVKEDITTGTSDTLFSPTRTCTRAQVVTFLYRYLHE